jgi:hypothetical protein
METVGTVLFAAIWYGSIAFWGWWTVQAVKNGDAGASGIPLQKKGNPIWFWFRITWLAIWLMILAAAGVLLLAQDSK